MADELRQHKSRFSDGRWKLTAFYDGMHPDTAVQQAEEWKRYELQLRRWIESDGSTSPTPHVALASYYVGRAWRDRGSGYTRSVTPEGWRGFAQGLALAEAELKGSASVSQRCPHWFNVMQTVALGQGWPEPDYEKLFESAVAREPSYYFYYFSKANFYKSRWYGDREKIKRFVDDAVARTYKVEGYTLYSRIYWSASREFGGEMFAPGNVDWVKMKLGFEFMNKEYPNSTWNLNAFAYFSCLAGDKATAQRLLREIGNDIAVGAWSSGQVYADCLRWSTS